MPHEISRNHVWFVARQRNSVKMDATKRPLTIPPEISNYAEKHGIFDLYKVLTVFSLKMVFSSSSSESA